MTLTKKISFALGLLAAASAMNAQNAAIDTPVGVLGQRYVDLSFGAQDIDDFSKNVYNTSLEANLPVSPSLDLGVGYSYGWFRGTPRGHVNTLSASGTFYAPLGGVKPFLSAAIGHQWSRFAGFRDNAGVWGAAVGVEIPFGTLALTPRIAYSDDFEGGSSNDFTYEVEAHYWVSQRTAVYGTIGRTELDNSPADSWNYQLGLRWKF